MKDTTFGHELGQPKIEEEDTLVEETIEEEYSSEDDEALVCFDCNVNFTSKHYLYNHLLHHIRQPSIALRRVDSPSAQAPIKITLKGNGTSFEIISSPQASPKIDLPSETAAEAEDRTDLLEDLPNATLEDLPSATLEEITEDVVENMGEDEGATIRFSPNYINTDTLDLNTDLGTDSDKTSSDYNNIPGAEPTPPPEPSPDYPKIRIKSGLMKEPLTITEITDENPNGDFNNSTEYQNIDTYSGTWGTPSLEDPLRINENDSSILSNLFSNNNDRAKDLGFTTSDTEFISLDTNRGSSSSNALQVYNSSSSNSMVASNPLDTLTNLPMQQLAQQVSRLQPNGNNGMHQQNVLINIQQFPQAPQPQQPHAYQPHMYPPHPPQPMYSHPYQYQPPTPMYYPQAPQYPQHMPPPQHPRPQLPPQQHQQPQQHQPQQQQQQQQQQPQQQQQLPNNAQPPPQYRPPQPRQQQPMSAPRQPMQQQRGGMQPRGMQMGPRPFNARQPMAPRQRAPMIRGRGGGMMMGSRGPRPRMPMQNGQAPQQQQQQQQQQQNGPPRLIKRTPEMMQQLQAKRKKMDVLVPDKHDDADCQVISVQPKNTGLPQIQSIQGNAPEPGTPDNSIMHLSDSITLSVRNPPPKPPSPKKSDAKDVANILATRGITVTATAKEKAQKQQQSKSPEPPVAINLNSSVCIIPTAKNNQKEKLTTVDLTDESEPPPPPKPSPPKQQQQPQQQQNRVLPFQCDLCPAKYPNSLSLNKHRMSFHKTGTTSSDYGIPLIDLKSTAVVQRLASMGIHNYIPLPGASTDSTFALPIVNMTTFKQGNLSAVGATSVLTLGPIRTIPRPIQNHK